jgi:two-component system alkaline phosphatase synthesis response regulator PhoP
MSDSKKILLIDDDVDFVAANRLLLEAKGYCVVKAYDGDSGIALAKEEIPDLILLDVMMTHDTEGFDVSRRLKDIPELKNTVVIMLTGIKRALNLPFSFEPDSGWLPVKAILEKPIPPEKLLREVGAALA